MDTVMRGSSENVMQFQTKTGADAELAKNRDSRCKVFCPLTRVMCRRDCECYNPGYVYQIQGQRKEFDPWYVSRPYCDKWWSEKFNGQC